MPTRKHAITRNQFFLEAAEHRAARQVSLAYNQSRKELLARLIERWTGADVLTPGQSVDLLRRLAILEQIDERMLDLERELGIIVRDVIISQDETALKAIKREVAALPADAKLDLRSFSRVETQLVERFVPIAMGDLELGTQAVRLQLRRELQSGLIQGESFPQLVRRLFDNSDPSVWRNGRLSTERMVRRTTIHANNAAKQGYLEQARQQVPEVKKQVNAAIGPRTTNCCLAAHGQIQPLDAPFELVADPRFAPEMMHPPFHWNCRTSITMWHPAYERGGLTTANMVTSARAEGRRRRS